MVSNKAVKYSTEVPKQQHESERKGTLDMAWWLAVCIHGQRCLISRKLIWFEVLRNFVQTDEKNSKNHSHESHFAFANSQQIDIKRRFKINRMTQEICRRLSDYEFCIPI